VSLPHGKYFSPEEMTCRDGTPYPDAWAIRLGVLFVELDTIRQAYGGPLQVVSGYRTEEYNRARRGAERSQHVMGRAVDLRPVGAKSAEEIHKLHNLVNKLLSEARLPAIGGVGVYPWVKRGDVLVPGWVHVDIRPRPSSGHIARWEGEKFGDEQAADIA